MARSGSFGGNLSPFGGGSLGGFSAYDIGSNLAELEVHKVTVAWGNGTATDEAYLAALQKAVDMTSPDTRDRETAVNRIEDAQYQIGRSKANAVGLDALIAFDQAAIAKMTTANQRYRSVKDSLDSELASRRSRDYGDLVRKVNDGDASTEELVAWVTNAIKGIDSADPDLQRWTDTEHDLAERVKSEKDQEVYQDYQQLRMKPDAFLAYLTNRRDEYDTMSPQFDDWSRRLEDAQKQVKADALSKQDTVFFNAYEEGKRPDSQYLSYLKSRIDGMESDDPQLGEWKHRLTQAAFSLAEDKLRFDVQTNKQPVSRLVTFYRNYQRTLNPGSAEYRAIARNLLSLGTGSGSGGGGGGGGGGSSGGSKSTGTAKNRVFPAGKLISQTYTLDSIAPLLRVDVGTPIEINAPTAAGRKAQRAAEADRKARAAQQTSALELNIATLKNASVAGDGMWLFQDPRNPGQMTPGRLPDGSPMLNAQGKPVMVPGSAYLPVTSQALSNLLSIKEEFHYSTAAVALATHDAKGYYYQLKLAVEAGDAVRSNDAHYVERTNKQLYDQVQPAIDLAMKTGDWATAINLATTMQTRLRADLADPMLTDSRREALTEIGEKLGKNPLLPQIDQYGQRIGGAIDIDSSSVDAKGNFRNAKLLPGWHHVLDRTNEAGVGDWGLVHDDLGDMDHWAATHVTVYTTYGGQVVQGEVKLREAPTPVSVEANSADGALRGTYSPKYLTYTDEHGQTVRAFSMDGSTWIRSMNGAPPVLTLNVDLASAEDADGNVVYTDTATGETVFTRTPDGPLVQNQGYFDLHTDAYDWYGMNDLRKRQQMLGRVKTTNDDGSMRQGQFVSGHEERYIFGAKAGIGGGVEVGGKGQQMQVIFASDTGELNLTGLLGSSRDTGVRGRERSDSFMYGPDWYANPKKKAAVRQSAEQRAKRFGENAADLRLPGRVQGGSFGQPTIAQQLPANTPVRFDGMGFNSPVVVPTLRPITAGTTSPVKPRASALPTIATKTPLPAQRAAPVPVAPRRRTTVAPKPPAVTSSTGGGLTIKRSL